jgi:hypothetical protein
LKQFGRYVSPGFFCSIFCLVNESVMQAAQYFPPDYSSARQSFLAAALACGAEIESFIAPALSEKGEELFTDVAALGQADAVNALVIISGTHGVEGFAGSGIQTGLLLEGVFRQLCLDNKVIIIHALNPYGFAEKRRFNEDNVDLNRNFIDHTSSGPINYDYDQLATAIAPRSFSRVTELSAQLKIRWYRLCHGRSRLQHAVTHGQYSHPQGLFYGGHFEVWSNQLLRSLTKKHLTNCSRVTVVDLHTGLGSYGKGEVVVDAAEDDPVFGRSVSTWGVERVKSTISGASVSSLLVGTINQAFVDMLPTSEVTAVGLEFGTLPTMTVFNALRAENWLHHHGDLGSRHADEIKEALLRAFYPDNDAWKERVMEQGRDVVERVLRVWAD